MEATSSSCPSISKITKEIEKYIKYEGKRRKKGKCNSEAYIEKVKSILSKIELANKNENSTSRLYGICPNLLLLTNTEGLAKTKELIKVLSQHKSSISEGLITRLINHGSLVSEIPSLKGILIGTKLSPSGALDILNIKLKHVKEEHLKLASGGFEAFIETAVKMAQSEDDSETAMIVDFEMPMFFSICCSSTPFFLRKQKGEPLEILITDCAGIGMHIELFTNILQNLPLGAKVYTLTLARKGDSGNSTLFAVSDIIHYCKLKNQGIDLFEFAKQNASPMEIKKMDLGIPKSQSILLKGLRLFRPKTKSKFYSFDTLPIKMMKLTGYKKSVRKFFSNYPEMRKEIVDAKTGETLSKNIKRYSYGSPKRNCHAGIKNTRFISLLALQAIEKEENLRAQSKED